MPSGAFVAALSRARVMAIIRGTDTQAAVATAEARAQQAGRAADAAAADTPAGERAREAKTTAQTALDEARASSKPVFIDFTGYTCTNCRWMEANIFPLPAIHAELERFVRVQLFTDGVGREYEENQRYQREQFGTVALPLYAILDPQGKPIHTFPGMTRKPEEFLQFLGTRGGAD